MDIDQQLTRRTVLRYGGTTGLVALAGCEAPASGDETPTETPTPTDTPTPTQTPQQETPQSVAQQQFSDYNWSLLDDAEPTATTEIEMTESLRFQPTIATVSSGATVTWANTSSFAHTLVIPKLDVDRSVDGGTESTLTVEQTGTFDYVCDIHPPKMLGRLIVEG